VPPELAAAVVKEYLLPLFEAEDRRLARLKTKMQPSPLAGIEMKSPRTINTVYDELKLSDTLSNELSNNLIKL